MKKNIYITIVTLSLLFISPHFLAADITTKISFSGYGIMDCLYYGNSNSNHTLFTDTDWVWDRIDVIAGSGANSVLDQHVDSNSSGTHISRNALYIGPGSIKTESRYKGFSNVNVPDGEDSITGIYIEGDGYGALIQNGSLEFNANFGGIKESVAVAGGNYYFMEQFGFVDSDNTGDFTPSDSPWTSVGISGDDSATIGTFDFGSTPQPGPDRFYADSMSWAYGEGSYSFNATSPTIQTSVNMGFGWGDINTRVDFDTLKANAHFWAY